MPDVNTVGTGVVEPADYPHCALLEAGDPTIVAELEHVIRTRMWMIYRERPCTPSSIVVGGIGDAPEPH